MAPNEHTRPLSDGTRDMKRDASRHAGFIHTGATESRRIPPSGHVSPDGRRNWPEPSMTSRIAVYGGVALAVAGGTAGLIMLLDRLGGSPSEQAVTQRPKSPSQETAAQVELPPVRTARRKKTRRSPLGVLEFATTIRDATALMATAFASFKAVAEYADGITKQFHDVADNIRKDTKVRTDRQTQSDNSTNF